MITERIKLRWINYVILGLFTIMTLFPFYVMFVGSFKTQQEIVDNPYGFPGDVTLSENIRWFYIRDETPVDIEEFADKFSLTLPINPNRKVVELAKNQEQLRDMLEYIGSRIRTSNYVMAIKRGNLVLNLIATMIIMFGSVAVLSIFGGMAGYPLSKSRYSLFNVLLVFFLIGMTLPRMLALVPLYKMMIQLNLLNNPISLILIYGASRMSITIIVFTTFYKAIPSDLEDASDIDGLNRIGFYFKILLPMSKIPILTIFIVSGTFVYNDFLTPLLFMGDPSFTHIQVGLSQFVGAQTWFFGPIFAGVTVTILPMLIIYMLMNRTFISGVTAGAVKG